MLLTWILASLHVISAIAWLGGAMIFGFVIGPALEKLSPGARGEFMVTVVPRIVRFFQAIAGMTVVFGALLLLNLGGSGLLNAGTTYGLLLSVGVGLALIAFVVSEFVVGPLFLRAVHLTREVTAGAAGEPQVALKKTMGRAIGVSTAVLVLLLVVAACMVGAGFY